MKIRYISGPCGYYRHWVEVRADASNGLYTLVFGVDRDFIVQLWVVISPKLSCYCIDKEGPVKPALTREQQEGLTSLLIVPPKNGRVVITPYYRIEMVEGDSKRPVSAMFDHGSAGPKGLRFPQALMNYGAAFNSEDEAKKIAKEFEMYREDQNNKDQRTRTKEMKKK